MEQVQLNEFTESTKIENLSREELIQRYTIMADELVRVVKELYEIRKQTITDEQLKLLLDEQLSDLRETIFGNKSERYKKKDPKDKPTLPHKPKVQKPSERYPNLPVVEKIIRMEHPPQCKCCGKGMNESGMTEDSERLTIIPKKFEIEKVMRVKYRCETCHGDIQTAPLPPRIKDGALYSDAMIIDIALSKYCDLIPVQRYVGMAARSGVMDLPPHSLIETTHYFADFLLPAYLRLKEHLLKSRVIHADETPHKMLEGSDTKHWFLWGFSTATECYFECHNTRSGDVASDILLKSQCEILITDVFSGYAKAVRLANIERKKSGKVEIKNANCNAHARRYFFKSRSKYIKESEYYLDQYHEIYKINSEAKGKSPDIVFKLREQMRPYFEAMKKQAMEDLLKFPSQNKLSKALNYFLENYEGLTLCLEHPDVPIDNNSQERALRSHVVGRKTWYGTHSERAAETAAILFSLVESCKLNHVNPRDYFKALVDARLQGLDEFTPLEFKSRIKN